MTGPLLTLHDSPKYSVRAAGRLPVVEYDASEKVGQLGYLRLRGELVGEVSLGRFKHALEDHFVDDGVSEIRIDLSGVTQMSLEGVGILLQLQKESRDRGKRLVVEGERDQVREKLEITGTLPILTSG